jgi:Na+/H+-dicarboxylate symporter
MQLYTKIFLGLVLGAVVGIAVNLTGVADSALWVDNILPPLEFVGSLFIRLIMMIVIPLVVASLMIGVASLGDIGKLGRIGGKTVGYYMFTTAISITIGLTLALIVKPGSRIAPETRDALAAEFERCGRDRLALAEERPSTWDVLLNMIPDNPVGAAASGNLLPLIVFVL